MLSHTLACLLSDSESCQVDNIDHSSWPCPLAGLRPFYRMDKPSLYQGSVRCLLPAYWFSITPASCAQAAAVQLFTTQALLQPRKFSAAILSADIHHSFSFSSDWFYSFLSSNLCFHLASVLSFWLIFEESSKLCRHQLDSISYGNVSSIFSNKIFICYKLHNLIFLLGS